MRFFKEHVSIQSFDALTPSITRRPLAQYAFRNQLRRDPSFDIGAALDKQKRSWWLLF